MGMRKSTRNTLIVLGVIGAITVLSLKAYAKQNAIEQSENINNTIETTRVEETTPTNSMKDSSTFNKKDTVLEDTQDFILENKSEDTSDYTDEHAINDDTKLLKTEKRENLNNFLFIGDSYTYLLKDTIKANNENVFVEAKSGSRPSYWLDRVANMPSNDVVEGVVLLIGVNGASTDANKEDVVTLMNKLSEKYPDKKVYVQKIFHVGRNFHAQGFNDKIDVLNEIIENHVNTLDNFTFIDTTTGLLDEDGYLKYTYDELHIDSSKNDVFYNNILTAIQECEAN